MARTNTVLYHRDQWEGFGMHGWPCSAVHCSQIKIWAGSKTGGTEETRIRADSPNKKASPKPKGEIDSAISRLKIVSFSWPDHIIIRSIGAGFLSGNPEKTITRST
jgi:hypothetical protein